MTRATFRLLAAVVTAFMCMVGASLIAVQPATAALIIYDGFAGYNTGNITGQNVGTNTIGLDKTTSWISNNTVLWDVVPTGLTIGSGATALKTSGGAVIHRTGSSVAAAKLDLASYVGTLYASYLVSIDLSTANGVVFTVIGEGSDNTVTRRFRSLARNSTSATSPVGVNYANGATQARATSMLPIRRS